MTSKAQELSLNMIAIGSLLLITLIIVAGFLIFRGGDLLAGLGGMGPSNEEVSQVTFISSCRSKCSALTMNLQSNTNWYENIDSVTGTDLTLINSIKAFCCYSVDLNSNGALEMAGSSGPEYCSRAYASQCTINRKTAAMFCKKTGYYDFTVNTGSGLICS